MRIYEAFAEAFALEGVDVSFTLMGDGNMHFATALSHLPGVRTYMARHEHGAVAMASAYARASGKPGVASVTCGPGLTQLSTALATAVYARIPLVIFAGESPIDKSWYGQRIEQAPIVTATGAHYIAAHSLPRMQEFVREAFYIARTEQRPVVIGAPYDLQLLPFAGPLPYRPSTDYIPRLDPLLPHPAALQTALDAIAMAQRIMLIGGRGLVTSGGAALARRLAAHVDGLTASTLPARGVFEDDPFCLGVAGGYATALAREQFKDADLVIAIGASLTHHTADGGALFPQARVLQIDEAPQGLKDSLKTADLFMQSDAREALSALLSALEREPARAPVRRTAALAQRIAQEPADPMPFVAEAGLMDPRDAVAALDQALPRDYVIVNGTGHSAYFSAQMRGRRAEDFLTIREFGAIGNGLCYAIGAAAAHPDKTIVCIDGDGSFLMHVQELDTIRRHGLRILICVLNDGAYGPEIHKLRVDGIDDSGSVFGRGDLGAIARGFGLRGSVMTDPVQIAEAAACFVASQDAAVWDLHVSDRVVSPMMRRAVSHRKQLTPV